MTLEELIEIARRDLPSGYGVYIKMDKYFFSIDIMDEKAVSVYTDLCGIGYGKPVIDLIHVAIGHFTNVDN